MTRWLALPVRRCVTRYCERQLITTYDGPDPRCERCREMHATMEQMARDKRRMTWLEWAAAKSERGL